MTVNITIAGNQIQGGRNYQEDSFVVLNQLPNNEQGKLLVLADGMGGHAGGAQASKLAVDGFVHGFTSVVGTIPARLEAGLRQANNDIAQCVSDNEELANMGTTLIGAYIDASSQLFWVSVGDSPLWLVRQNQLQRINDDHSMVPVLKKMVELGDLTQEEFEQDPSRHRLRSALVGKEIKLVDLTQQPMQLYSQDKILLASDGVETLSDAEIAIFSSQMDTPEGRVSDILGTIDSKKAPDQDNATLILADVQGGLPFESPKDASADVHEQTSNAQKVVSSRPKSRSKTLVVLWFVIILLSAFLGLAVYKLLMLNGNTEEVDSKPPLVKPTKELPGKTNAPVSHGDANDTSAPIDLESHHEQTQVPEDVVEHVEPQSGEVHIPPVDLNPPDIVTDPEIGELDLNDASSVPIESIPDVNLPSSPVSPDIKKQEEKKEEAGKENDQETVALEDDMLCEGEGEDVECEVQEQLEDGN